MDIAQITVWAAFLAGFISFISPCTLPLFPVYLSYITGISVKELQTNHKNQKVRKQLMMHSFFFLLGVSFIFFALGFGATFFGQWLEDMIIGRNGNLIQQLAGIFIVVMGLFVSGIIQFDWLMKDRRLNVGKKPAGFVGTTFAGMGFAAGWTPCIGPIFASILMLAASNPQEGLLYTLFYILGFTLPFFILTFFIGSTRFIVKYSQPIMKIGGAIMILMGILLFTGKMTDISIFILRLIEGTWLENLG
ncbi:cytochrome c biogenesis CcdA family protein [Alkalihalophilus marmarensis]|jgi:cytochrome c-type biogenesis protein|uniref:Cytochrome C biogenesis protein n=1 Tax=Alkalihalophilus marmarensis DSM 21297 TaxID=1188261 RepID=U6SSE2_9BACI|nr:cytochrome c biogenesis protein CcdA [Alkalihalophilus marmarensis]ERN54629.1 cytochrome C biogenesis protein [Alkalihalophilus marmarensis DSM 21297]